jgi:hypothetical protein
MSPLLWAAAALILIVALAVLARRAWRAMVEVMRHGREG